MAERTVFDQDGKAIGRLRIPADIEGMLWQRPAGDRVRMPVYDPLEHALWPVEPTANIETVDLLVIYFWVNDWRYEHGNRADFGAIIASPPGIVRYEMALQAEADADRTYERTPTEEAYDALEKATAARKLARLHFRAAA